MMALRVLLAIAIATGHYAVALSQDLQRTIATPCSPFSVTISDLGHTLRPTRLAIVTTKNRYSRIKEQDLFVTQLAKHLNNNGFLAFVSPEKLSKAKLPMQSGVFDERELLDLARDHRADAVLYCDVSKLDNSIPMQLQVSAVIVNVDQAVSIVSLTGSFNLSSPITTHQYLYSVVQNKDEFHAETFLSSPSKLIEYVSNRTARRISQCWGG